MGERATAVGTRWFLQTVSGNVRTFFLGKVENSSPLEGVATETESVLDVEHGTNESHKTTFVEKDVTISLPFSTTENSALTIASAYAENLNSNTNQIYFGKIKNDDDATVVGILGRVINVTYSDDNGAVSKITVNIKGNTATIPAAASESESA